MLLLAPSMLVPCLRHQGVTVWDTLAIAEYLNEVKPKAGLLPADRAARAHCRAISGEMHSGFTSLRSALADEPERPFPRLQGVEPRADRHRTCVHHLAANAWQTYGGPVPVRRSSARHGRRDVRARSDAPSQTYDVAVTEPALARLLRSAILALPEMREWKASAQQEPEAIDELEVEF